MRLICLVEPYGDRMVARPQGWGDTLFFEGAEPAGRGLIVLDLPGLDNATPAAIIQWLRWQNGIPDSRSQVPGLPAKVWRPAVLDDLLEVENPDYFMWTLPEHFSLEDFQAFAERWLPEARQRLAETPTTGGEARLAHLNESQPRLQRIFAVLNQAPQRIWREYGNLLLQLEQPRFEALRQGPLQLPAWLELAEQVRSHPLRLTILNELAGRLVDARTGQEQLWATLEEIYRVPVLAQATLNAPLFWQTLERVLRFEANVRGETVDISNAQELRVVAGWPLFTARRIGRIIPGRITLFFRDEAGRLTYVAGGRELKFQVRRAGGQLYAMDNTLVIQGGEGSLQPLLLTVELLDTLANIDPDQALARIADLNLPPDHPVYHAATAARTDPRYARILADLLIELVAGLDADIARRLVRAQSARRRR